MKRDRRTELLSGPAAGLLLAGALCLLWSLAPLGSSSYGEAVSPSVGKLRGGEYSLGKAGEKFGGWRGLLLGNPLDLNGAETEDLMAIPGVGEKTAAKILDTREKLGGFACVEEVKKTPGIGKVRYGRLKEWLTVEDPEGEK